MDRSCNLLWRSKALDVIVNNACKHVTGVRGARVRKSNAPQKRKNFKRVAKPIKMSILTVVYGGRTVV